MNTTTKQPAAIKPVLQPTPVVNFSKMGFNASKHCDPVPRSEKDGTSYNPDINNDIYNTEAFSIVRKRETDADKLDRLYHEAGGEYESNTAEAYYKVELYTSYRQDYEDTYAFYAQERLDYLEANYDDSWEYDKETYKYYGTNSDAYIEMVENGDIIHEANSCRMNPAKMGASLSAEEMDSVEADKELSASSIDNESEGQDIEAAAAPSESEPAIESSVQVSSAFAKASSPEKEPEAAAPEPVTIAPVLPAANSPSYQMSA